jgi:hypothetical protein
MPQQPLISSWVYTHMQVGAHFKTDQPVSHHLSTGGVFVAAPDYWPRQEWMHQMHLTPFGTRLLEELEMIDFAVAFVRYKCQQFEIFVRMEYGWDSILLTLLWSIAKAHSGASHYNLETLDMSGGKMLWDSYFPEELEQIEEPSGFFCAK